MNNSSTISIEWPGDLPKLKLPPAVQARLQALLDQQSEGTPLTEQERQEAQGLVDVAEMLTLLRMRAERPKQ
jgi:hypothetical protein